MAAGNGAQGEHQELALSRRLLQERQSFDVVLHDGTRWTCELLEYSEQELLLRTHTATYLVPYHSVNYFVLDEQQVAEEVIAVAVEEIPALQEFLEEPPTEPIAS
jgi:hypothetical protein